jgi:hypothetical protein
MRVRRISQNSKSTSTSHRCAQRATDSDNYRTAVSRACKSHTVATIGPHNITHVNRRYTQPVPDRDHPPHDTTNPHQRYSLPGNICDTILSSKKNKGAGISSDSIDLLITLVRKATPQLKLNLHFIFEKIYQTIFRQTSHNTSPTSTSSASTRTQPTTPSYAPSGYPPPSVGSLPHTSHAHSNPNSPHTSSPTTLPLG